ncbi:hypothetical protein [Rheinheimera sp. MMS21-TC3]|uniref:hypothetical protein n=1 Tax=Rheinheimera sp. MMS21-TC3 TaxID=3072790 RepID=UPI0028C4592F|nr:hypothetical protein [Rheinheimera sp. MMS21-TC3]WNO61957.1 hypothetical protein RDV63_13655 [Rheinheimera sp. MMS21-TC3]
MDKSRSQQPHFWQVSEDNQSYTELCNALYERELLRLSELPAEQLVNLAGRLASITFYIRRAASNILQQQVQLQLDSQNASWYNPQAKHCPARKQKADQIDAFYQKYAKPGLIVPIYIMQSNQEYIVLDSIDEVDAAGLKVHCNHHGWFAMSGMPLQADNSVKYLLKPAKAIMIAACCGHQWLKQEKTTPRLLNLRELLLTCRLNWRNFAKPILEKV